MEKHEMYNGEANVYYSPERFGLEVIYTRSIDPPDWGYDMRVVWRDVKTGALYTARESGCSCPVPFEHYTSVAELERIADGTDFDRLDEPTSITAGRRRKR